MTDEEKERLEQRKLSAEMLLQDAREALGEDDLEGALDLLGMAAQLDPDRMEVEGYVDMVRSQLLKRYRERVGDASRAPRVATDPATLGRFNLSAGAGFVLSLIDGSTSVEDLLSLSGMDSFEAFRILNGLLDAGIAVLDA